jgi:hypothetical protein
MVTVRVLIRSPAVSRYSCTTVNPSRSPYSQHVSETGTGAMESDIGFLLLLFLGALEGSIESGACYDMQ